MRRFFSRINQLANRHEVLLSLLLLVVILRLPTLFEPSWYLDENIYLAIGQGLRQGEVLYQDITDYPNKPPLIYLLAAAANSVYGFRLLLLFWTLMTTALFYRLIKRFVSSQILVIFSSLLFIFFTSTPIIEGTIANAEIFFILPVLASVYLLTASPRSTVFPKTKNHTYHLLAGLLLGVAFLFKIHVALDIAAIGLFFFVLDKKFNRSFLSSLFYDRGLWLFIFGFILPVAITLVMWAILGVSPLSLFLNAAGSSGYVSVWQRQDWLLQTLGFGHLYARLIALLAITLVLTSLRRRLPPLLLFSLLWLFFALFAALLSTRPYPHYLIQLVPAAVLVVTLAFSFRQRSSFIALSLALLVLSASLFRFGFKPWQVLPYYQNFTAYLTGKIDRNDYYRSLDSRSVRNLALARKIISLTLPEDRIYVWGTEPEIYALTSRLPVGKYVVSFHVADVDYYNATMTAISQEKPPLVVWMQSEPRPFPALASLLATDYYLLERVGDPDLPSERNQGNQALVYRRR